MSVSTDPDHRFDLAIALNDLETALDLVRSAPEAGSQPKWKVVGDKALEAWQLDLAQEAFEKANDLPALLLLLTSLSDRAGLERLASTAREKGANNIAFAAYLQLGDSAACVDLLADTGRIPEAALFARTYAPQKAGEVVTRWKAELREEGREKVADVIADPSEDSALFPELEGGHSGEMEVDHKEETGSGSGVLVEKEDEPEASEPQEDTTPKADAEEPVAEDAEEDEEEKANGGIKAKLEKAVDKVKEPVEGLVEKVKDLAVDGEFVHG